MKQAKKNKEHKLAIIRSRWPYPISQRTINWAYKHGVAISFGELTTPVTKKLNDVHLANAYVQLDNNK